MILLYMWVEFDPIGKQFVATNIFFMVLAFLPIVIPIVKQKMVSGVEMTFLNSNILEIGSYHPTT